MHNKIHALRGQILSNIRDMRFFTLGQDALLLECTITSYTFDTNINTRLVAVDCLGVLTHSLWCICRTTDSRPKLTRPTAGNTRCPTGRTGRMRVSGLSPRASIGVDIARTPAAQGGHSPERRLWT